MWQWLQEQPKIERAAMDGTAHTHLFSTELGNPKAITVDEETDKIYWTDTDLKRIEFADFDGERKLDFSEQKLGHHHSTDVEEKQWKKATEWAIDEKSYPKSKASLRSPFLVSFALLVGVSLMSAPNWKALHCHKNACQWCAYASGSALPCSVLCLQTKYGSQLFYVLL